jgi:hypothetical protein
MGRNHGMERLCLDVALMNYCGVILGGWVVVAISAQG